MFPSGVCCLPGHRGRGEMCPKEASLSEGICMRADTGSLSHQAHTSRVSFLLLKCSSILFISDNMRASLAWSSGGRPINQEGEENVKSPNFLVMCVFAPSVPSSPHPSPHVPPSFPTNNRTDLEMFSTLYHPALSSSSVVSAA